MDVTQIVMPKEEAKSRFEAYRKKLAKIRIGKANAQVAAEYKAAMTGYKALADGTPLIDLEDVFQACPVDEKGRPRMAIARADRTQVQMFWRGSEQQVTFDAALNFRLSQPTLRVSVRMNRDNPTPIMAHNNWRGRSNLEGYALVPMVPATVRPKVGQLHDWFILWEVEAWADRRIGASPDIDPYLLKHLGGSLYAVIAEWDLTDLERSIMKGRAGN